MILPTNKNLGEKIPPRSKSYNRHHHRLPTRVDDHLEMLILGVPIGRTAFHPLELDDMAQPKIGRSPSIGLLVIEKDLVRLHPHDGTRHTVKEPLIPPIERLVLRGIVEARNTERDVAAKATQH